MICEKEQKEWFSARIEAHMDALYSLALRLTRNEADAEDLVAESVIKAWTSLPSLEDPGRFKPWLFRILHNRFVSDYRKKSVRPSEISLDESAESGDREEVASLLIQQPDEFVNWWANPEQTFFNHLLGEDIARAIECLPEAFRVTVLLVNVEGLTYDEAGEVLEVSPGTIRSRMNRGRTLLQKALWQHARDAGLVSEDPELECNA